MAEKTNANLIAFRAFGPLAEALAARGATTSREHSELARRDLERYYAALAAELAVVELSEGEACLIVDALNGCLCAEPPEMARLLWAQIDDAIRLDHLDEKWQIDGPALVAKLRGLTLTQALAAIDCCERVWTAVGRGDARDIREMARAVGLLREQSTTGPA